jgi:proline racemase
VLLETGIVEMQEPSTTLLLEAPGGLVRVVAQCSNGHVDRVTVQNVPSFVHQMDCMLEVSGMGSVRVDTAFGGDSFVMVDALDLGFALVPDEARELAEIGVKLADAATEQLGFVHPENPDWRHYSFCQIAGPLQRNADGSLAMRNAVAIRPAKLDRSPTGTGVSARMALLRAKGQMEKGQRLHMRSIIDSEFIGEIVSDTTLGGREAIVPQISGRAWITGTHQHMLDPRDPWPQGYRIADTWPHG